MIRQGEVYWLRFGSAEGSGPAGRCPAVVVQHDRLNSSAMATTVVAAIASNLRLGLMPGNVRIKRGEAGLGRPCVVNVSQIRTIDRTGLGERIGTLGPGRLRDVLRGLSLLLGTDPGRAEGSRARSWPPRTVWPHH